MTERWSLLLEPQGNTQWGGFLLNLSYSYFILCIYSCLSFLRQDKSYLKFQYHNFPFSHFESHLIPFEPVSEARTFKMNSPPTSSPPGPRSPLNATVSDDIPDLDFLTSRTSNGTTRPMESGTTTPEERYAYINEKTSMVQADRADTEDLDNYFVCELPATIKIQDTYMPWSDMLTSSILVTQSGPLDPTLHSKVPYFLRIRGSILPVMILPLFFVAVWATVITFASKYGYPLAVDPVLLTVLGFVVGLSLSFRSATAYERYIEGRK